jgi:hypothetical protein
MTKDVANTLAERGARYGAFIEHAKICQGLLAVVQPLPAWQKLDPDMRQAISTIFDKIARILNGDPFYDDNWHDIQGYAKLVEDRIKGIQELFAAEPADDATKIEKASEPPIDLVQDEDFHGSFSAKQDGPYHPMKIPENFHNANQPPQGWVPAYDGDQSWRGRGYNPENGYDG